MKNAVKKLLQRLLGFETYLKIFAGFKVKTIRFDRKEGDFFVFMSLLPDKGIILDVGANLGIMTYHLLKHFKHAQVWAFEPIPDNNKVLRHLTKDQEGKRLKIFSVALGAEPGKAKMVLPEVDQVKMQGLSHVVHDSICEFNDGSFYEVNIDTLDRIVGKEKNISGIKLDVENFEYFVLKGGEELLKREKPIVYTELWDNENRRQCIAFLTDLGYKAKYYDGNGLQDYSAELYQGQNFFFIPTT